MDKDSENRIIRSLSNTYWVVIFLLSYIIDLTSL